MLKSRILKLVCTIFNSKIKLSMSHILIILTSKNCFPTHIRQYCKDELCMGNLQGHWTCRSSVFAQMCFKSCGNCLTATAGIGGRTKPRNVVPYCRLASGTGEVTSGRAGASHLLQSSQLLEIRHEAIFWNCLCFFSVQRLLLGSIHHWVVSYCLKDEPPSKKVRIWKGKTETKNYTFQEEKERS